MVAVGDDAGILAGFTVTLVTLNRRLGDGRRRLHVRALYTLAIGGNAYRFVILLGRSKERSDAAQAMSLDDEVIVHRADLDLIAVCRKVNFDFARYRRPDQYRPIADQV
ncbi:hypothetical protein [Mesorhizobium wenxiniae]|uniref:Uncharacterized protein n=1 Tax=Mesorhizobium wenxiniae TaxID=2014805 RepID=A0A271KMF6_9HYPH|nr:hypothetical protein [Mesorhizobium wenxiniae]PAP96942.1 hypothetical protein CIT31_04445 [Mesorhizobium wenxiniae]